jgi:hypothetical protein
MRTTLLVLAVAVAALGWPAMAQDATETGNDRYYAELTNQCPDKSLQFLSPTDLRDGLDGYMEGLSPDAQDQLRRVERARCSSMTAGVGCVNDADIAAADQLGLTPDLAASICAAFLRCRGQSDCDHAR